MESYQCLVIGISRYQFLPPLNHGEADAKAIYQFFIEEAKISQQQVLLISDTSSAIKGRSIYPNQDNLLKGLKTIAPETLSTWDKPVSVFFNGYGLNYQGEDYLIPIDGNPQDIVNTGINVRSLLNNLQQSTKRPILLILNLYTSGLETKLGQQILSLAQQKGIAIILSLHSTDEIITRTQSTFTTALLEALHYYRREITLTQLAQYLGDRLPSLSFSNQGVVSSPIVISPSFAFSSQSLFAFTQKQEIRTNKTATQPLKEPISAANTAPNLFQLPSALVATSITDSPEKVTTPTQLAPPPLEEEIRQKTDSSQSQSSASRRGIIWQWKWFWLGGLFALLLLILLFFLIRLMLLTPVSNSPKNSVTSSDVELQRQLLNRAITYLKENQASSFNRAINEVRKIPLSSPVYPQAQEKITRWSQVILDIAQGRAKEENFKDAIAAARLVPNYQDQIYTLAIEAIKEWQVKAKQKQVNQALIAGATALIKPLSASSYNQGITILRQIPEGEPSYQEAQELIEQWSQKIYLLANSRAAKGNYQLAIVTAQLVPSDTLAYERANQAISDWKIKQNLKRTL